LPGAHERPGLRHGDRKHLCHICQGKKALRHTNSVPSPSGSVILPPGLWITHETDTHRRGLWQHEPVDHHKQVEGSMTDPVRPRRRRPTWRDPRLGIGVLLVAASVALGSWVVSSADDTVTVWAATDVLSPGHELGTADFHRVSVAGPDVAETYLTPGSTPVEELVVLRTIGEGELIPRSALGDPQSVEVRTVTVPVNAALAGTLDPGARVDLWVAQPDPEA